MNSAQRRKLKREFPHVIKLVAEVSKHYFEHDDKVTAASKWCRRNSHGGYILKADWDHAEFKFATEKDAVHFALKWL